MPTTTKRRPSAAKIQAAKDKTQAALTQLQEGVAALASSDDWKALLAFSAKFHNYSFRNRFLIQLQYPTATRVAGYQRWRELGRQVQARPADVPEGAWAIRILAPSTRKVTETNEETGEESDKTKVFGFHTVGVFDISQTDPIPGADPLPEEPQPVLLTGDSPEGAWEAVERYLTENGWTVNLVDPEELGGPDGDTNYVTRVVRVRNDYEGAQRFAILLHETGHAMIHGPGKSDGRSRGQREVEAESIAYVVGQTFGIDTNGDSFPYVAGWSGGKAEVVQETAERVLKTANELIEALAGQKVLQPA